MSISLKIKEKYTKVNWISDKEWGGGGIKHIKNVDEETIQNKPHIICMWVSVKVGYNSVMPQFSFLSPPSPYYLIILYLFSSPLLDLLGSVCLRSLISALYFSPLELIISIIIIDHSVPCYIFPGVTLTLNLSIILT